MTEKQRVKVLFIPAWYPERGKSMPGPFVRAHVQAAALYDDVAVMPFRFLKRKGLGLRLEYELYDDCGIPTYDFSSTRIPVPLVNNAALILNMKRAVNRVVREWGMPDVIHTQDLRSYPAIKASLHLGKPYVISQHWTVFLQRGVSPTMRRMFRWAFQKAELVLPVNSSAGQDYEAYGIKARFRWLPNTLDTDIFQPDPLVERRPWLLHVSTLHDSHKRIRDIFRAFYQVRRSMPDAVLQIVGGRPDSRAEAESAAAQILPGGSYRFHGIIDKEIIADLMRTASGLVLPSAYETFGCVLMEAMACGCPVLTTRVGGIPAVVREGDGIFVEVGDVAAIAVGMLRMLNGNHGLNTKRISRQTRKRFNRETIGRLLSEIHREFI